MDKTRQMTEEELKLLRKKRREMEAQKEAEEHKPANGAPKNGDAKRPVKRKGKKKRRKNRKKRRLMIIIAVLVVVVIAAGVLIGMSMWKKQVLEQQKFDAYQFDTNAMAGRIKNMTEEEIQAELNRVVEEGMFNISIASAIVLDPVKTVEEKLDNGRTVKKNVREGEARIENIQANRYHMQVDIFRDDNGECIYSSKLIRPGYSIEYIQLDEKAIKPGEYDVTAVFSAITQEELQLYGQAAAQIKLYVTDENGRIPLATATPQPSPTPTAAAE
ncbi:MAG: hypothetical protein IKT57_05295 [Clostridia bacterium]|nr:hypothetical protein [Clostridia bacterium]